MISNFLADSVTFGDVILAIAKAAIAFVICLVATMLMVWFERKVVSRLQNRIGPNVAGPFGILQTLADGIKLFFKEDIIPSRSDRFVFQLAPYLSLVPAFLTFAIIPIAGDFTTDANGVVGDGTVEVSDGQLADGLDEVLARFKHPKIYIAVDQLPRNAMSKVQKAALRGDHAKLFID